MDPNLVFDQEIKDQLMNGGMDDRLATHFAHLFIRDPIVIFEEDLQQLDLKKTDHFENLQSTNWQHMRFKPPPADNNIGWRVEFRSMEIQVTDFENAAFSVFIVLVTRAILSFDLNFYIPIRRVDENMERAHKLDAVLKDKFHFRKKPFPIRPSRANTVVAGEDGSSRPGSAMPSRPGSPGNVEDEYCEMSIDEIINGSDDFPGLIPIVESYLDSVNVDVVTRCKLSDYLRLISQRASGELDTTSRWIRNFIDQHPDYKHDSVVGEQINHDLIGAVIDIGEMESTGDWSKGYEIPGLGRFLGKSKARTTNSNGQNGVNGNHNGTKESEETVLSPLKRKSEWIGEGLEDEGQFKEQRV